MNGFRQSQINKVFSNPRAFLEDLFHEALAVAAPSRVVEAFLPPPPKGRTIIIGAGKAAAEMAAAVEALWPEDKDLAGLVITRYGHSVPTRRIAVVEASHPVPDSKGHEAALRIMRLVESAMEDDLVICLLSGGGSALLALPTAGLTIADKQAITRDLLACGAPIAKLNTVRKHLSAIKGGRLAIAASPAPLVTLAISDVPGDDPAVIASGPTVADPSTCAEARAVIEEYSITPPPMVQHLLNTALEETPKPGDQRLANNHYHIIARPITSLKAASSKAEASGVSAIILGDALEGEAREVGLVHAGIARSIAVNGLPFAPPVVLLSGGETTVTMRGNGQGGRNSEFLLSLAIASFAAGIPRLYAIACDTDGIDGNNNNAGAYASSLMVADLFAIGLDASALLSKNDSYSAFAALDNLIVTGPTRTNVNDFRAILVLP